MIKPGEGGILTAFFAVMIKGKTFSKHNDDVKGGLK